MKVDEFIEDLEALCKQYWESEHLVYRIAKPDPDSPEEGVVILFDNTDEKTK
jgi:hypothetical protein